MENDDFRYPIGKEEELPEYEKPFDEALKHQLLFEIKTLPAHIENAIQNLDASQLATPYRANGWTLNQVVHHLADSHINAYVRFKLGLTKNNPVIKTYEQSLWADLSDTNLPVNISITLLYALHARWYQLMFDMTNDDWQKTIYHPERKMKISLWQLLKSYAWHGKHHTAHVLSLRQRMNWH